MSRLWQQQRGSTALALTWFMLAAVALAIGLDSFLGVYIARQQAETAADAAALAVTRAISRRLPDAVRDEAAERVQAILTDPTAAAAIQTYADALEQEQEECKAAPPCVPYTDENITALIRSRRISEYRAAFGRLYRGSLTAGMAVKIVDGTWSAAPITTLRDQLIPDDQDLGCLVLATAQHYAAEVLDQADALARANRASLDRSQSAVALAGGRHRLVVRRTVHPFGADWIFSDGSLPTLHVQNDAVLTQVGSRTPHYPEHC